VFPVGSPGMFVLLSLVKSGGVLDNNISFLSLSISFLVSWYESSSDSTCLKVPGLILVACSATTSFVAFLQRNVHHSIGLTRTRSPLSITYLPFTLSASSLVGKHSIR